MSNSWISASGADLSAGYARHAGTLRGALRHALVARALRTHLPPGAQLVLDVGGGDAHQAVQLARAGHHVTVLEPDPAMLERAAQRLASESDPVRGRVNLVPGRGEQTAELVGGGWDLVCCHGVLMYQDDPALLLATLVNAAREGGLLSILTKNGDALAMRPGLEARWADALAAMGSRREVGRLGVPTRADTLSDVQGMLSAAGAETVAWYGVRIFTDHLGDAPVGEGFDQILEAEWAAGERDPYRLVARNIHIIARKAADGR
ncbi:methyltransferase [Planotetraspora sp. GP83]|uniref:methyltransferase n=1 Tax=Planotetraspora sp. GP83 TaxID=3156264 RepID=UPI00351748BF